MSKRHAAGGARSQGREYLSLREAVVLADVPEKAVRKDIETGVLASLRTVRQEGRLRFAWHHVYVLAAVYGNSFLNGRMRKTAIEQADEVARKHAGSSPASLALDKYISIDWQSVYRDVKPRVETYAAGLERVEERAEILGGDAVFKGTRLPVTHIGKMLADGESAENVLEDFPSLTPDDLVFSELYHRAHPPIGRPRRESLDAAATSR